MQRKNCASRLKGISAVRDRHAAYYMAALRQWDTELQGPHQQEALAEMDAEIDNVRAAWSWAVKQRPGGSAGGRDAGAGAVLRLASALQGRRKSFSDGGRQAGCRRSQLNRLSNSKLWASALAWQARFNQRLGQIETAREQAHQSLAVLDELTLAGHDVRRRKSASLAGHRRDRAAIGQLSKWQRAAGSKPVSVPGAGRSPVNRQLSAECGATG